MSLYSCSTGWLLEMQEDGSYLPFFGHTREQEMVWKELPSDIQAKILASNPTSSAVFTPHQTFRFNIDNWVIDVNEDGQCTINTMLRFNDATNSFVQTSDKHVIKTAITLPVKLKNTNLIAHATVNAVDEDVIGATANISFNGTGSVFDTANIYVVNSFLRISVYNNSGVFITIHGELA